MLSNAAAKCVEQLRRLKNDLQTSCNSDCERFNPLLQFAQAALARSQSKGMELQRYVQEKVERLTSAQSDSGAMLAIYATPRLVHRSDLLGLDVGPLDI
jgi:hypothetical protein